jgi:hypothetical protein
MHERAKLHSRRPTSNQRFRSNIKHQIRDEHQKQTKALNQAASIKGYNEMQTHTRQIASNSNRIKPWISKPKRASSQATGIQIKQRALKIH